MDRAIIAKDLLYLLASVLFIVGLKSLTHPRTAVRGNLIGAAAMLIAVIATVGFTHMVSWTWIVAGVIIGGAIGVYLAQTVPMTGMPQMVGLLNGLGGGASFLIAGAELAARFAAHLAVAAGHIDMPSPTPKAMSLQFLIAGTASGLVGSVTLFGSLVAVAKLAELRVPWKGKSTSLSRSLLLPGRHAVNALVFLLTVLLAAAVVLDPTTLTWYWLLVVAAAVLGILTTIPIGGADMPVVIALMNSYSGLAAGATGFVINNTVLIIAGALVGASGLILTGIMCKAMNRSLANVMFATLGPTSGGPTADEVYQGRIKAVSAEEIAMLLDGARRVVIVPGYGLAVSQAQHAVHDLAHLLESRGTEVEFAIHPVAGRMPGHMNVLLAEADIPYDKLKEMDEINPTLGTVDVALVVGANDVVNPAARTDPNSPIAGMPIINVDQCRTVVVIKRSLSPGFAGIPNPLFAADNTRMFFNDGKKAFLEIIAALKEA